MTGPHAFRQRILAFTVVLGLTLGGCANDADTTRAEAAGVGAATGAVIGALLGGKTAGIVGGAVAGGVVGTLVGNHVAAKKADYAAREDQLRASAAQAEQTAKEARDYNNQLQAQITVLEQDQAQLKQNVKSAASRQQAILSEKQQTAALLQQTNEELAKVQKEIANQQAVLAATKTSSPTTPAQQGAIQNVSAGVTDLQVQSRALEEARAQLQSIDERRAY